MSLSSGPLFDAVNIKLGFVSVKALGKQGDEGGMLLFSHKGVLRQACCTLSAVQIGLLLVSVDAIGLFCCVCSPPLRWLHLRTCVPGLSGLTRRIDCVARQVIEPGCRLVCHGARERGEEWNEIGYGPNDTVDAAGQPVDKGPGAHLTFVTYMKDATTI